MLTQFSPMLAIWESWPCLLLNIEARELPLHSGALAPSLTTGEGELTLTAGASGSWFHPVTQVRGLRGLN